MTRYDEMVMQCSEAIKPICIRIERGTKVMWLSREVSLEPLSHRKLIEWTKCVVDAQRMKREM